MDDKNTTRYEASIFEIISNYLFVIVVMIAVWIFKERNLKLKEAAVYIVFISAACFLHALFSKFLLAVQFNRNLSEVEFKICGNMFLQQKLTFKSDQIYFTYKDEIIGRGAKRMILTFYDSGKTKIIRVFNGFSQYDISQMVFMCESMGVKEIVN